MSFIRKKKKLSPSEKRVNDEFEKMKKLYDAYRFIYANADNEAMKRKITEMAQEHLSAITDTIHYDTMMSLEERRAYIRKKITENL
jgi:hypothetical protein